jgi:GR25 family glycosyltransferase involved in LPS biosynthesis
MSTLVPVNNMYKVEVEDEVYFYDPTVRPNNKILSPGEIGCAISHLKCYDKIDQHSLIIEDDAYINNWDMFFKTIRNLPETFDICYMQNEATWWPPVYDTPINEVICKTKGSVNLTIGYILTQRGKKALEYLQNIYKQRLNITGKFLCLPSDDLISHASRANLLYEISPYIRPISSQHLESHIGIVDTEKSKNYYKVSVEGIHDNWTGLGNQMFRYAVGKLLSVTTNSKFILPCQTKLNIAFKNIPVENIEFKNFEVWEEEEFKVIKNINSSIINQSINSNVLIKGYLQNASYFEGYEYIVKEFFQFRDEIELSAKQYIQTIKNKYPSKQIIAVHIRVRDFIQETSEFLYELYTPSSLSSNIDLMKDDKNIFLVFSNNIEYVKTHFQTCFKDLNHEYVFTPTKQLGPHRDGILELCIMTLCDNYIISSSTYSWWGAFLSKNKNKKVIAPKVWLNPRREDLKLKDTSGIYCKDWIITE